MSQYYNFIFLTIQTTILINISFSFLCRPQLFFRFLHIFIFNFWQNIEVSKYFLFMFLLFQFDLYFYVSHEPFFSMGISPNIPSYHPQPAISFRLVLGIKINVTQQLPTLVYFKLFTDKPNNLRKMSRNLTETLKCLNIFLNKKLLLKMLGKT